MTIAINGVEYIFLDDRPRIASDEEVRAIIDGNVRAFYQLNPLFSAFIDKLGLDIEKDDIKIL